MPACNSPVPGPRSPPLPRGSARPPYARARRGRPLQSPRPEPPSGSWSLLVSPHARSVCVVMSARKGCDTTAVFANQRSAVQDSSAVRVRSPAISLRSIGLPATSRSLTVCPRPLFSTPVSNRGGRQNFYLGSPRARPDSVGTSRGVARGVDGPLAASQRDEPTRPAGSNGALLGQGGGPSVPASGRSVYPAPSFPYPAHGSGECRWCLHGCESRANRRKIVESGGRPHGCAGQRWDRLCRS